MNESKTRRCVKFVGYLYLPTEKADYKELRYHTGRKAGRLIIYDEYGKKPTSKALGFDKLGTMLAAIEKVFQKRAYKITKKK